MKFKGLLLGSAAGLVALSGAQAADLPVKAKPVEYVKVCSLYGAGFYYIPGTETCIKLGGYLRAEVLANSGGHYTVSANSVSGANNRLTNFYSMRARQDLNIDTRTATEYGVVRTFFDGVFTWNTGSYTEHGTTPGASVYDQLGATGVSAPVNASGGNTSYGSVGVYFAFIQFAGFTMGRAISQFAAPWTAYPGNNFDSLVGATNTVTGITQFSYTADFGQGVTATVSVQDQAPYMQAGVNNINAGAAADVFGRPGFGSGAIGSSDYGGTTAPDLIGMIRVDQAWGLFQASAAIHNNHAAYYGGTELTGRPEDKIGWAGQLSLSIKNIPTGPGDVINMSAVYTNGATRYNISDLAAGVGSVAMYGSTNVPGAYQSVAMAFAPDSVFGVLPDGTNSGQQLVSTWGFQGAYTHNWDPFWNTSLYGAFATVSYNTTAKTLICGVNGSFFRLQNAPGSITNCDPNYNIAQLGLITRWTPVKGLTFSGDLVYTQIDQKMQGTINAAAAAVAKPVAVYQLRDQGVLQLSLRAQRNF